MTNKMFHFHGHDLFLFIKEAYNSLTFIYIGTYKYKFSMGTKYL